MPPPCQALRTWVFHFGLGGHKSTRKGASQRRTARWVIVNTSPTSHRPIRPETPDEAESNPNTAPTEALSTSAVAGPPPYIRSRDQPSSKNAAIEGERSWPLYRDDGSEKRDRGKRRRETEWQQRGNCHLEPMPAKVPPPELQLLNMGQSFVATASGVARASIQKADIPLPVTERERIGTEKNIRRETAWLGEKRPYMSEKRGKDKGKGCPKRYPAVSQVNEPSHSYSDQGQNEW